MDEPKLLTTETLSILVTFLIALIGWIFLYKQNRLTYNESKCKREDDLLAKACDFFTGGTQKRSVGLSLFEGLVHQERYFDTILPLLYHQLYYLVLVANPKDSDKEGRKLLENSSRPHEVENVKRILDLIIILSYKRNTNDWNEKTKELLERRKKNNSANALIGIEKSYLDFKVEDLEDWINRIADKKLAKELANSINRQI